MAITVRNTSKLLISWFFAFSCLGPSSACAVLSASNVCEYHVSYANHAKAGTEQLYHAGEEKSTGLLIPYRASYREVSVGDDTSSKTLVISSTTTTMPVAIYRATTTSAVSILSPAITVWDTGIGNNFTVPACPDYINTFLRSSPFKACEPFSLLLESSVSFFRAKQSLVRITQALDVSCGVKASDCSSLMTHISHNLTEICVSDYALQNPVVLQINNGLLAYQTLYAASCLKSTFTQNYCFADAITNSSSPSDSYIYYLPIGQGLASSATPSCNRCLQDTMQLFKTASADRTLPIANTYGRAALLVNGVCGSNFVATTLPAAENSGGIRCNWQGNTIMLLFVVITLMCTMS